MPLRSFITKQKLPLDLFQPQQIFLKYQWLFKKSKYDGSDEKYNEWAINKTDSDIEDDYNQDDAD